MSEQRPLAPKGFKPKAVKAGNYVDRHPTRYIWRKDIQALIRRIYEEFGWDNIHITTYVDHPASEFYEEYGGRDTSSFDVWGPLGRGDPLPKALGDKIFNFVYSDPKPPWIDWVIWRRVIRMREEGFVARPFGEDPFSWHDDHIHITFTGSYRRLPKVPLVKPTPRPQPKPGRTRAQIIDDYFREKNYYPDIPYVPIGELIVDICKNHTGKDNLWVSTMAAACELEGGGKNILGCDAGAIDCNEPVTKESVKRLKAHYHKTGISNGIGPMQITYFPFVEQAEAMGGAHIMRNSMTVGARYLNDLLNEYGYLNALEAYNDGNPRFNDPNNPYEVKFAALHVEWRERLRGATDYVEAPEPKPEPVNEEEEVPTKEEERKAARAARMEKRKQERAEKRAATRDAREAERARLAEERAREQAEKKQKKERPTKVGSKRGGAIGAGLYLLVDALHPYIEQIPPDMAAQLAPLIIGLAYFLPRVLEARTLDE